MRGLELRKGSVDLIVNDLSPDIYCSGSEGRVQVETAAGHRLRVPWGFELGRPILSHVAGSQSVWLMVLMLVRPSSNTLAVWVRDHGGGHLVGVRTECLRF